MKQTRRPLAELAAGMEKLPQVLLNVEVERRFDPAHVPTIVAAQRCIEQRLGGEGRVVLRASGTEPVIRVMVEGHDEAEVRGCADELADAVRAAMPNQVALDPGAMSSGPGIPATADPAAVK